MRKHVLSAAIGALPLSAIGSPHLDELLHTVEAGGASAASVNKLRGVLHTVFSKAKKAGKWVGENPVAFTERRKVAKRVYATLRAEEVPLLLAEVPAEWRPLFAAAVWTGMRRGELFALRKSDVDLTLGTIMVARSNARDTTKGGHADLIPIAAPLFPILKHQLEHAPGSLVFPAENGTQRSPEADPQKILRTALARSGLVEGYEHVCRWCGHKERHADNEQRHCPKCLKRTNGTGKPLAAPRGRALWPKAIPRPMRFHDLRHTTATLLLRAGVDAHRVQRLLRHRDVRTTTGIYGHLDVEDLRAAVATLPELGPNWVQMDPTPQAETENGTANTANAEENSWWALQDSNLRPLPCERPTRGRQGVSTSGKPLHSRRTHIGPSLHGSAVFGTVWTGSCCILAARPCATSDRARGRGRARRQLADRLPSLRARRAGPRAREQCNSDLAVGRYCVSCASPAIAT